MTDEKIIIQGSEEDVGSTLKSIKLDGVCLRDDTDVYCGIGGLSDNPTTISIFFDEADLSDPKNYLQLELEDCIDLRHVPESLVSTSMLTSGADYFEDKIRFIFDEIINQTGELEIFSMEEDCQQYIKLVLNVGTFCSTIRVEEKDCKGFIEIIKISDKHD